jgi:hypothetical protein
LWSKRGGAWASPIENLDHAINSLLNPFIQPSGARRVGVQGLRVAEFSQLMRDDRFQFIPDAGDERRVSSVLTQIYRDIGLAAVADALRLPTDGFEPDMIESLERGEFYLLPPTGAVAQARTDA